MKLTLLEIVQNILSDMDSDNVNSIDDTVESQQVALIVKDCFMNLTSNRNWHDQQTLFQLKSLADVTRPNYMAAPEGLKELITFRYNCKKRKGQEEQLRDEWREVKYMEPDKFLRYTSHRNSTDEHVVTIQDFSGSYLLIRNDKHPTFWTTFDDEYIVCDSWDGELDDTLHADKTQCMGYIFKKFEMDNDYYPDIPEEAYPALVQAAKSQAFLVLKQMENPKAEAEAQRQQSWLARKNWKLHGVIKYPDYGRRGVKRWSTRITRW